MEAVRRLRKFAKFKQGLGFEKDNVSPFLCVRETQVGHLG